MKLVCHETFPTGFRWFGFDFVFKHTKYVNTRNDNNVLQIE